jgi:hypothetical protein
MVIIAVPFAMAVIVCVACVLFVPGENELLVTMAIWGADELVVSVDAGCGFE